MRGQMKELKTVCTANCKDTVCGYNKKNCGEKCHEEFSVVFRDFFITCEYYEEED